MRMFTLTVLASLLSLTCYANAEIELKGTPAKSLLKAFQKSGAILDCGAGTCGTEVQNLECKLSRIMTETPSYECTLDAQNETGAMSPVSVQTEIAQSLYEELLAAGLKDDCRMGACSVAAQAAACLVHGMSIGHHTYECRITP